MSLTLSLHLSLQTDVYVFLFTDLLLITKAKKGDKFKVIKPVSESYLQWMSLETEAEFRGVGVSVHATFLVGKDGLSVVGELTLKFSFVQN